MRRWRRASWRSVVPAVALVTALGAASGDAQAQRGKAPAASAGDRARARALGEEGLELFGAGRYEEAYARFEEADRLYHAPTLVLFMARCQAKLGRPLAARALYERVLAEPIPDGAPRAFADAQASARTERADVDGRVARLRVEVTGGDAQILVDGAPFVATGPDGQLVEPGEHTIEVIASGAAPIARTVKVAEGASETVTIALPARATPPPPPPRPREEGSILPAVASFGVGAAGVGVGTVVGLMTLSRASDLKDQCDGVRCPAWLAAEGDRVDGLATVSTIGFVVGGVGVAAGVVLLVVRPGADEDDEEAAAVRVRPGRIDVEGRF